ncbi:MAG: hypothetical protein WDM90_13895 [Ferruginibacter sp.]
MTQPIPLEQLLISPTTLTRLNTFGNRFPNFPQIDISGNFGDEEETALFTSMNALATSQEVGQSQDTFTYTYNDTI